MSPKKPAKRASRDDADADAPALTVLEEGPFLRLMERRISKGGGSSLVLFRSDRFEEVLRSRGADVAGHLVRQLSELLREELRPNDILGRLGQDCLGLHVCGPAASGRGAAERLHRLVQERSRFPVSTGLAHAEGARGGAKALLGLARAAADDAREDVRRRIHVRSGAGAETLAPKAAGGLDPLSGSLGARYQRLVLLNRMSLELFSDKAFEVALQTSANILLALTGAHHVSIAFTDELGAPVTALRQGDPLFEAPEAVAEERGMVLGCLRKGRLLYGQGTRQGWVASPLPPPGPDRPIPGALVLGFFEAQTPAPERDQTLLQAGRQLANARLIQQNLQQQKTMAAVSAQSADGIVITDLEMRILSWNSSAEELFQYEPAEVLGKKSSLLAPEDKLEELKALEAEVLAASAPRRIDTTRRRKDGGLIPVEASYTLLKDDSGRPFSMVRVFRDITKRKEVERMKTEFVSLVSHELRTPLTAVRGFAETLFEYGDELEPPKRKHYLGIIVEEAKRLGNLVTDFLDISRLEAGGVEIKPKEVDLAPLCLRLATLLVDHPSRPVFKTDLAPDASVIWADEDQLYRVFLNLCGNALKYTPHGGTVTISSRAEPDRVELAVSDQGPGISREDQKRVFEKFFRVADAVSQKTAGTGLGLAICKGIVESHGGRIWLESAPGAGTTFRFTLPGRPPRP